MNLEQARSLIDRQARAWEQADIETVIAAFAPDGELISPGGRWQGHAAIRVAMRLFYEQAGEVKVEVTRVFIAGNLGAVEWSWSETRLADGGRRQARSLAQERRQRLLAARRRQPALERGDGNVG